jgi:anti-anti-sigma regulatory factor
MEFKIDTKPTYTHITPVTNHLNANLTAALHQKCRELTESGSVNFIIDLHNCLDADKASFNDLGELHEKCYTNEQSLVFTGISESVNKELKDAEVDEVINIAPTVIEAIDIVSMEILERDLFNEDEP